MNLHLTGKTVYISIRKFCIISSCQPNLAKSRRLKRKSCSILIKFRKNKIQNCLKISKSKVNSHSASPLFCKTGWIRKICKYHV
ncbi:hypothetical protein Glove_166g261 [Diversispora epigaea]|uniref:Uncharacterized protein n=1 Tax=Diversispora epigaea TaxID=1348612 RepID=A0A397IQI1_9GLOM|nr:hypothetical protein Glove_166g261 [Diversispora epigaea]